MNNEPVAWMDANDKTIISNEKKWANDIPLYTHPAKTLTDEEIEDLADKYLSVNYKYGEDIYVLGEVEFARAILKKASEK